MEEVGGYKTDVTSCTFQTAARDWDDAAHEEINMRHNECTVVRCTTPTYTIDYDTVRICLTNANMLIIAY